MRTLLLLLISGLFSLPVQAQNLMVVRIEANGLLITEGEGPVDLGGVDTTEYASVLSYGWTGEQDTSGSLGNENYGPLRIVKPLARSSVLLRQALDQNQRIDLTLRLFASNASEGTTDEVYRIDAFQGRVVGVRPFADGVTGQYLEEVRIAWSSIDFTDVETDTSYTISWR